MVITRPLPASVPTEKGAEGWPAPTFVLRGRLLACLLFLAGSAATLESGALPGSVLARSVGSSSVSIPRC